MTHPLLNHSAVKLTPYCSATLLWCTLVPPGRDCGHLPQKPHGREQVFIEHMAGQLSNHGHNTWWVNSPGTNWCFLLHKGHLMVRYSPWYTTPGILHSQDAGLHASAPCAVCHVPCAMCAMCAMYPVCHVHDACNLCALCR